MSDDARSPHLARLRRVLAAPEANVAIFAFLLNFPWEFLQIPFFRSLPSLPHWDAVKLCTMATFGDAAIMLVSFWCVATVVRTRRWILAPTRSQLIGFVAIGVAISGAVELSALATGRWSYSELMPVVPLLGIGLIPLLQWLSLPLLTAWFVRRQLT